MQAQLQPEIQVETREAVPSQDVEVKPRWNPATRVAFRFFFVYFGLQVLPFPFGQIPFIGGYVSQYYRSIWGAIIPWVGAHILGVNTIVPPSGSGDTTHGYVRVLCFLTVALTATVIWSLLDRKRPSYPKLNQWLRLGVRFWLAGAMISYGMIKAVPLQMSSPSLSKLLLPYGESSGMGVLWNFMGTSLAYQSITGFVELIGGILLIFPRTALLGSLVSVVAMGQVFLLNMCYDVPVKIYSFHLFLASLFLLTPHMQRLANVVVFNRTAEPARVLPFFRRRWLNWGLLALQVGFGLYLVGGEAMDAYRDYYRYGPGAPTPAYYGIWNVEEFIVDGELKPPLTTDGSRWQRVIIDRRRPAVQSMTGTPLPFQPQMSEEKKTLTLSKEGDPNWKAELALEESEPGRLTVVGEVDGHKTQAKLVRYDESKFFLKSRGFNWIQERPVNR